MRLTKRYEHYDIIDLTARPNTNCSVICRKMSDCESCPVNVALSKLADYEDAEEQGLLLRLPVVEGTTVFGIIRYFFRGRNENQYEICECKFELSMLREIGKTIFLTREEAESALAEKGE